MLASATHFSDRLRRGLVADPLILERLTSFARSIGSYLLIKSWLGTLTAIVQIILMWVLGVDFAVLWGVFSVLFNFVPIGAFMALPLTIMVKKLVLETFPEPQLLGKLISSDGQGSDA